MREIILMMVGVMMVCSSAWGQATLEGDMARLRSLAGSWEGTSQEHGAEGTQIIKAEYEVTSGGSVVVEKLFAGSPQEMVSVYRNKNGAIQMTHYCMLKNQPEMELKGTSETRLSFEHADADHTALAKEMHMHALTLDWKDKDNLTQTWIAVNAEGQTMQPTVIELKRVKRPDIS